MSKKNGHAAPNKAWMLNQVPMITFLAGSADRPAPLLPLWQATGRILRRATLALLAWQLSCSAMAECKLGSGGVYRATLTLPASLSVPRDAAPGSVIASARFNYSFNQSAPVGVHCDTATIAEWIAGNGQSANAEGVIPTGTPGIGYRLTAPPEGTALKPGSLPVPLSVFNTPSQCGYPASGKCYVYLGAPITLELVKTGDVQPGAQISGLTTLLTQKIGGVTGSTITLSTPLVQVTPQSCTVSTRPPKSFDKVGLSEMKEVNSRSPARSFALIIDCRGTSAKVAVTFTDASSPSNRSDLLSLSQESKANGFGIQILFGNQKVRFGADSRAAGNPNQLVLGDVSNRIHEAQFTAQYVRTSANATAGIANGSATFTMSYQ
ncbi:fimbrial protein [Pseudomonas aeruginosa]|uniref:fimbrial protein n=1 Tax=Pseudomonas aeruginosa TaxID=287 RepID=UPI00232E48E2|nr:fimbrial protein [Pseudomonas aeruginosa]